MIEIGPRIGFKSFRQQQYESAMRMAYTLLAAGKTFALLAVVGDKELPWHLRAATMRVLRQKGTAKVPKSAKVVRHDRAAKGKEEDDDTDEG